MSFTFPDPLVTTEFTAANGITYMWDDDSTGPGKWVVKSFLHEGVLVDLSPIPPTRPDRPDGPNDGDLWFDTSPDELTLYVYSEDSGAWIPAAPPTTLEGRVAENEALQIEIIQRLQANEALTNLHSRELLSIKEDIEALAPPVSLNSGGGGAKWNKDGLSQPNNSYVYFGIEVAGSSIASIKSGNVLYLNKLRDCEGVRQDLRGYTPTGASYVEVYKGNELYFKAQLKASTYKVADRNPTEIECDFSGNYPIVSKDNTDWDTSTYRLILTGLTYTGINKGNALKYTVDNNTGSAVSRPGEISTTSGFWSSVNKFSFGTADADGTATPTMVIGSTIETYNATEDKTNVYTVTNAGGAPTVVDVQYVSGDCFYTAGDELEVNIY